MNNVVEVEGTGTSGGAAESAASICGGWIPEDQFGPAGDERRGSVRP